MYITKSQSTDINSIFFLRIYHKSKSIRWQANPFLYHRIWEIKRHNLVIQFTHNSSEKKSAGSFLGWSFFITAGGSRWCQVHDAVMITVMASLRNKGLNTSLHAVQHYVVVAVKLRIGLDSVFKNWSSGRKSQ